MASQKQTGFSLEAAIDLQARAQSLQFTNRVAAQLVAPGRSNRADFFDQGTQGNINFVLEQGGTRAGASRSDVQLIKDNGLHSGFGQVNGHESPGNPTANNNRVTRHVTLQRRIVPREAIIDRLKGMTRSEIHAVRPPIRIVCN